MTRSKKESKVEKEKRRGFLTFLLGLIVGHKVVPILIHAFYWAVIAALVVTVVTLV
jgi:hypothetical protein